MTDKRKAMMSVIITENTRFSEIPISNSSQLVFIADKNCIALDFYGKRSFYRAITSLETENDRQSIEEPVNGSLYFVRSSCILYIYDHDGWIPLTQNTSNTVYIGINKPTEGLSGIVYVDTTAENISVWDDGNKEYICVGEKNKYASEQDIRDMFN